MRWLVAPSGETALVGAFNGDGCSLVYPIMEVEVIRKVQPELRGAAVGYFTIFQDIAYGASAPIAVLFSAHFGYFVVFLLVLPERIAMDKEKNP